MYVPGEILWSHSLNTMILVSVCVRVNFRLLEARMPHRLINYCRVNTQYFVYHVPWDKLVSLEKQFKPIN